jgi:DNA-binding NtrC family response regulator
MSISSHTADQPGTVRLPGAERAANEFAMVGDGAAMQRLWMQVERLGPHFRALLVRGESGTGKELAARVLHEGSEGVGGAFVVCHAATLKDGMGSQLGGLMRSARRGTLFFDAIDEMPLHAQDRLLWAMEQKMYTRMIASCSQDLRILVASGRFRRNLHHRLAMVEIVLEPLRNRMEDIPALAMYFLNRSSTIYKKNVTTIAQQAIEWMMEYEWPGNVRELEDAMRNGVVECEGNVLEMKHLISMMEKTGRAAVMTETSQSLRLQDVVERHVLHVLKGCAGNKLRAAGLLGISRSTLYRMLGGGGISVGR